MSKSTRNPPRAEKPDPLPQVVLTLRRHHGDIMSPERRSAVMSRIRGKDTGPERLVAAMLADARLVYETHVRELPGRPDFVLRDLGIVILVDGDFWHGWRFPIWRDKLSAAWEDKIEKNRRRDAKNMRLLRYRGWKVLRLWEHQLHGSPEKCMSRIIRAVEHATRSGPMPHDNADATEPVAATDSRNAAAPQRRRVNIVAP